MAKSQAAIELEDAEKTLELIQEVFDKWDDDGSRLIDAGPAMEQIGEAIADYFGEEDEEDESLEDQSLEDQLEDEDAA